MARSEFGSMIYCRFVSLVSKMLYTGKERVSNGTICIIHVTKYYHHNM